MLVFHQSNRVIAIKRMVFFITPHICFHVLSCICLFLVTALYAENEDVLQYTIMLFSTFQRFFFFLVICVCFS